MFRVVALPAPSDREKTQMYMQRYMQHFPAAGEVVIFDRSWYNRAGVEHVMGFCTEKERERFLELCPPIEKFIDRRRHHPDQVLAGGEQQGAGAPVRGAHRGSAAAVEAEPDGPAVARAVVRLLSRPRPDARRRPTPRVAPWYIVRSDDKKTARLNTIAHLLSLIPYKKLREKKVKLPKRSHKGAYNDDKAIARRRFVKERY